MASTAQTQMRSLKPPMINGFPIFYEDDKEADLGESNPHTLSDHILFACLTAHFARRRRYQVFSNLNLYYKEIVAKGKLLLPYVSPDLMIVTPHRRLAKTIRSYRIGVDGPAPVQTTEILSERSFEQRDLDEKALLYARLGVAEYILVDTSGQFLREKLLLQRLQPDGSWTDHQDNDGGITSALGFRLIMDVDGELTVLSARTGKPYVRPWEAEARVRQAEQRARRLEAELGRLRKSRRKKR